MSRLYKDGLRLKLVLNKHERKTLTHILNRSSKPYQRERAAALVKIASGLSPHIYVVLLNWLTVHKHEKALETFSETGIVPVFLPTYSPQSNPIEAMMTFGIFTGIVMIGQRSWRERLHYRV